MNEDARDMIEDKPIVRLSVPDGYERGWRTLWRKRPRERVLFVGRAENYKLNTTLNRPSTLYVEARDALADLQKEGVK